METGELRHSDDLRAGERIGGLDRFTQQIRSRRGEIGLSQDGLAMLADISRGTVKTAEKGGVQVTLTPKTIVGIHCALGWAPRFPLDLSSGFEPVEVLSAQAVRSIADAVLPAVRGDGIEGDEPAAGRRMLLEVHALVDALADKPPRVPSNFGYLHSRLTATLPPSQMMELDQELHQRIGDDYPHRWGGGTAYATVAAASAGRSFLSPFPSVSPAQGQDVVVQADTANGGGEASDPTVTVAQVKAAKSRQVGTAYDDTPRLPNAIVGAIVNAGLPTALQQVLIEGALLRQAELREQSNRQLEADVEILIKATRAAVEQIAAQLPDGVNPDKLLHG